MLRHAVLLTLKADTPPEEVSTIVAALRALPSQISCIREYEVGADRGLSPDNATVAVVARFDDVEGFWEYQNHPAHQAVINTHILPARQSRVAAQFDI